MTDCGIEGLPPPCVPGIVAIALGHRERLADPKPGHQSTTIKLAAYSFGLPAALPDSDVLVDRRRVRR